MEVQFVQPADGGAVAELHLELFLEIAVEFDGGPMALADRGRIFQHRHEQIAHALQFDFAFPAWAGLGDQGINATAIEHLDPEPHHAVGATKLLAERRARQPQQQRANAIEPDVGTFVGRSLHRHAEFLQRGVLRIRLNLGCAQPPSSAKTFQKVPELSSPTRKLSLRITERAINPLRLGAEHSVKSNSVCLIGCNNYFVLWCFNYSRPGRLGH